MEFQIACECAGSPLNPGQPGCMPLVGRDKFPIFMDEVMGGLEFPKQLKNRKKYKKTKCSKKQTFFLKNRNVLKKVKKSKISKNREKH